MINSTSCAAKTISAALISDQSSNLTPTTTYQPTGCSAIGFAPTVALNPSATLTPVVERDGRHRVGDDASA